MLPLAGDPAPIVEATLIQSLEVTWPSVLLWLSKTSPEEDLWGKAQRMCLAGVGTRVWVLSRC